VAILADANVRVLIHGVANPLARFQCTEILRHGTRLCGIIEPEALRHQIPGDLPIFSTVERAVRTTGATLSLVFNDPYEVRPVVSEAIDSGIKTIVCLTEHVPVIDAIAIRHRARNAGVTLVGPNSSGILSPGIAKLGFYSEAICMAGDVGVITKSGSISYAVIAELKNRGMGISTVVAIGGDRVKGTTFCDHLDAFQLDPQTRFVVLLGEIGGDDEEQAAEHLRVAPSKPVVAFISGRSVPLGQSLGHAGAIAEADRGDYHSKVTALESAGVRIAKNLGDIVLILEEWRYSSGQNR
jgi:succinyl-CoA synthetase alpha subunit